jgi:Zn-dependent protease with chaperone function
VANHDILIGSIAAGIAMSITFIARFALFFGGSDDRNSAFGPFAFIIAWIPAPASVGPAEAHLFIVNPLTGRRVQFANLFSTHPPTEQRIARLQEIAAHMQ